MALPLSKHFLLALAQADMWRCQVSLSLRILKNIKFLHPVLTHPPALRHHHGTRNIQELGHYLGAGPLSRRDVRVFFQRRESLLVSSFCACRPCVRSQSLPRRCRHAPAQRSRQPYLISSGGWFTQTQWTHHLLPLLACQFSPQPPPPPLLGVGCEGDGDKWCVTTQRQWQPSDRCVSLCVCVCVCTKLLGYSVFLCMSVSKAACHRRRPVRFTVIPVCMTGDKMTGVCGGCVSFLREAGARAAQQGCDNQNCTGWLYVGIKSNLGYLLFSVCPSPFPLVYWHAETKNASPHQI